MNFHITLSPEQFEFLDGLLGDVVQLYEHQAAALACLDGDWRRGHGRRGNPPFAGLYRGYVVREGAAGAEHDGPAKGGPADMTLDEIIRNLEDQVKDRESSIDEDDPDCIFRRDAEALREAVGLLSELAEYRKTGLSAADIQEAANLLNNTIHGDLPAELKSWVERCTWHVIIPASTSKIRRTPNERTENLRASQIWENPHHHRGW